MVQCNIICDFSCALHNRGLSDAAARLGCSLSQYGSNLRRMQAPGAAASTTAGPAGARVCEPRTDLLSLMAAYRAVRAPPAALESSDGRSAHKIPQAR